MKAKAKLVWIVFIMMVTTSSVSFAAQSDVYNLDGTPFASAKQMNVSSNLQKQVNATASKFLYEGAGSNLYTMNDAFSAWGAASGDPTTFVSNLAEKNRVIIKTTLIDGISVATINSTTVIVSADGSNVLPRSKWVTQTVMTAYVTAITAAQTVADKADATQIEVNNAVAALTTATGTFNAAKAYGTMVVEKSNVATLKSLSASYFNDSGNAIDLEIEGFSPSVTSYAITIYDPSPIVKNGKYLSLTGSTMDSTAAVWFDYSPQDLTYYYSSNEDTTGALVLGTAKALVIAQDEVTTQTYEVNFTIDHSHIDLRDHFTPTYYVGQKDSGGAFVLTTWLKGYDSYGERCSALGMGTLSVHHNGEPLSSSYYSAMQYSSEDCVTITNDYIKSLPPGNHYFTINISKIVEGKTIVFSNSYALKVIDTAPIVTYKVSGDGGVLNVYKYNGPESPFSSLNIGELIPNGGSAGYSNAYGSIIYISASAIDATHRIKSLMVTERGNTYNILDFVTNPEGFTLDIMGEIDITLEIENVVN